MAYMAAIGPCVGCGAMFSFNPNLVPSVVVNGVREPVCRACIERVNPVRAERGLPVFNVLPGAYDPEEVA